MWRFRVCSIISWNTVNVTEHPIALPSSEKSQPNKVELYMPLESLMDKRIPKKLQKRFGNRLKSLKNYEQMVLALALTENKVNHERLRYALPLHPSDISHILQKLTKLGLLVSDGYGRGTTYQLSGGQDDETLKADKETLQANSETLQANGETLQAAEETLQGLENIVIPKRMMRDEMIKKYWLTVLNGARQKK